MDSHFNGGGKVSNDKNTPSLHYQNGGSANNSLSSATRLAFANTIRLEAANHRQPVDHINKLPIELFLRVLGYLDLTNLCKCARVCKRWQELVKDGANWKHLNLFSFQVAVEGEVVENLSRRAGPFLKSLNLWACKNVRDNAIKIFAKHCTQIETLNLRECREITDSACGSLGRHSKHLKSLNMDACTNVTDQALNAIGNGCKELEHLDVSFNKNITENGFRYIADGCPNIKRLRLSGCEKITDNCLAMCGTKFPNLVSINIQKCIRITDTGVKQMVEGCPLIESICLSSIPAITDSSLEALGQHCHNIKTLELNNCFAITNQGFHHLTKHRSDCYPLQKLDIEECSLITDETLRNFATNCPKIREIFLSHCDQITDEGVRVLCASPSGAQLFLENIKLDNCMITDDSLQHLSKCVNLREIDLFDCPQITKGGINSLKNQLPHINVHAYFAPSTPSIVETRNRSRCCCCTVL